MRNPRRSRFHPFLLCLALACLITGIAQALPAGVRFTGRVVYRGTKTAAPGLLVEVVEAKKSGEPTDEVLGSVRADAEGRFTVVTNKETDEPIALVASAVRSSAETGGNRREEGYDIKNKRTVLGYLPFPATNKPSTILIERRQVQHSADGEDQ